MSRDFFKHYYYFLDFISAGATQPQLVTVMVLLLSRLVELFIVGFCYACARGQMFTLEMVERFLFSLFALFLHICE